MSCSGCIYFDKFNEQCTLSDEEWAFLTKDLSQSEIAEILPCAKKNDSGVTV